MASSQKPSDRKDNKNATPSSNIAPGEPLWNKKAHDQKSFDQGYDWHEPVSLMKGSVSDGNSLIRFGKFQFKRAMKTTGLDHGTVIDVPILRTEGSQGEFTLYITQVEESGRTAEMGLYNTFVNHGYYYCNIDLDLVSLNTDKGVVWNADEHRVEVTFADGETEKFLKVIAPYRTRVETLLPDVVRKKVSYWIEEYHNIAARNYRTPYKYDSGAGWSGNISWNFANNGHWKSHSSHDNRYPSRNIRNNTVWYKVYTLPMPLSWIRSNVGQPIYIDRWDKNYRYRVRNNTCRERIMPNRDNDETLIDKYTDGYITRYDHQEKMDLVLGRSRYTRFCNRIGGHKVPYCENGHTMNHWPLPHQGLKSYWWISNDKRITHRKWPEYAGKGSSNYTQGSIGVGATLVGALVYTDVELQKALNGDYGILLYHDDSRACANRSGSDPCKHYYNNNVIRSKNSGSKGKWQTGHVPMPYTGWKRDDFPWQRALKAINDHIESGKTWSADTYNTDQIHPETPVEMVGGGGNMGFNFGGAIPYQDQSWYESQRYIGGVDMKPNSKLTDVLYGYVEGEPHVFPTPVDREFRYGDPLTRVGDLAQPMFNHFGTKPEEYVHGLEQYVVPASAEDPSNVKEQLDTGGYDLDYYWKNRRSGYGRSTCHGWCHRWYGCCRCRASIYSARGGSWGFLGWPSRDGELGNQTRRWLNSSSSMPLCAGKVSTLEDAPIDDPDGNELFKGYRYSEATRGADASNGNQDKVLKFGSPGHGEQGTSRYLYDYRDLVHPLSSYELNDRNLRGYYRCCTDHIDRKITIKLEPDVPDPVYDIGEDEILFLINKDPIYDTFQSAKYDPTVVTDHTINAGPTFATNDEFDGNPTGPSVTDRLFTAQGAKSANPVLFLGVSAGNLPGGSMESREKIVPKVPSRTILKGPTNGESYNQAKLVDTVSKNEVKTYSYTLTNKGELDSKVTFGTSYQRQQGLYENTAPNPPPVFQGDKIDDWSFMIVPPFTPHDADFPTNTLLLSAGETVTFTHQVNARTETPTGYIIKQSMSVEESSGKINNTQLVFDVDVS